jgi:MFS family permease
MGVLIAARLLQGVGGALLTPGSLAILQASFHPEDRARAIGAWSGLGGVMTAVGPFLGGWLTQAYSWRLIFAPPFVLDYLAVHEVAHLIEMNHSRKFWRLVEGIYPRLGEAKAWLDAHGGNLHRYGADER